MHRSRVLRGIWLSGFAGICFANCNPRFARNLTFAPRLGDRGRYPPQQMSMNREPIIWRPNAIPQAEWDAKSRDEQISWWRNNSTTDERETKCSMLDVPAHYEKGTITLNECINLIFKRANHEETPQFLIECPDEILIALREQLLHYIGDDHQNWPRTYYMGSHAPWVSPEEIADSRNAEQLELWNGIAILKHHLRNGG